MDEFYQRRLFLKKRFTFKEKGIDIEFKDSDGDFSLFIPFDKIDKRDDIRVFSIRKKNILRIGMALVVVTIFKGIISIGTDDRAVFAALATAAIIGVMFYGYYYFTKLEYYAVPMTTGKRFQVLKDSPSAQAADDFIDEIYERRKAYFRREYFHINYENSSRAELNRMKWLHEEGIITDSEFEVVAAEIDENVGD